MSCTTCKTEDSDSDDPITVNHEKQDYYWIILDMIGAEWGGMRAGVPKTTATTFLIFTRKHHVSCKQTHPDNTKFSNEKLVKF